MTEDQDRTEAEALALYHAAALDIVLYDNEALTRSTIDRCDSYLLINAMANIARTTIALPAMPAEDFAAAFRASLTSAAENLVAGKRLAAEAEEFLDNRDHPDPPTDPA